MTDPDKTLTKATIRMMMYADIKKCPHVILVPEHYRDDGSCKCNDPNEKVMREWGYRWKNGAWR